MLAKFNGGSRKYLGRITESFDGTFSVEYDDGDFEQVRQAKLS